MKEDYARRPFSYQTVLREERVKGLIKGKEGVSIWKLFPAVQSERTKPGELCEQRGRTAQMKAGVIMHLNTLPPRQHLAGISDPRVFCVMTGTCCIDAELLTLPCLVLRPYVKTALGRVSLPGLP